MFPEDGADVRLVAIDGCCVDAAVSQANGITESLL